MNISIISNGESNSNALSKTRKCQRAIWTNLDANVALLRLHEILGFDSLFVFSAQVISLLSPARSLLFWREFLWL